MGYLSKRGRDNSGSVPVEECDERGQERRERERVWEEKTKRAGEGEAMHRVS